MLRWSALGLYGSVLLMCVWLAPIAASEALQPPKEKCERIGDHVGGKCAFVRGVCDDVPNAFDYLAKTYCVQDDEASVGRVYWGVTLMCLWLIVLLSLLGTTADVFFVDQLEFMSRRFRLSDDVAGATLMAFGNGAPDVFTAWNAIESANDFSLVLAELLGAAMFITTVVLGAVILVAPSRKRVNVDPVPFARDACALAVSVFAICACVLDGKIQLVESLAVMALYLAYLAVMIATRNHKEETPLLLGETKDVELGKRRSPSYRATDDTVRFTAVSEDDDDDLSQEEDLGRRRRQRSRDEDEVDDDDLQEDDDDEAKQDEASFVFSAGNKPPPLSLRGVHWSSTTSPLSKVIHVMEWPFSLLRHLSIPVATFEQWGRTRRRVACLSLVGAPFVLAVDLADGDVTKLLAPAAAVDSPEYFFLFPQALPVGCFVLTVGGILGLGVFLATSDDAPPSLAVKTFLVVAGFLAAVAWLDLLASETVAVLESLGAASGLSSAVLGVTALAWGNCIGDLVADTAVARAGNSKAAVASVFNSPLFSQIFSLGAPVSFYCLYHGSLRIAIDQEAVLSFTGVAASLTMTSAVCAYFRSSIPRNYAFVLFALYSLYVSLSLAVALSPRRGS